MKVTVSIYERTKSNGVWNTVSVALPRLNKKTGKSFLQDDRRGKFKLSWYEGRKKKFQNVESRCQRELPLLSEAIDQCHEKQRYLSNRDIASKDPTVPDSRKVLSVAIVSYLAAKSGCKKTLDAHTYALNQFREWAKIQYVDEISKALLRRFFEYLVDDEPENSGFTAAWKILRINAFYRSVLGLRDGDGVITKKDYKRELEADPDSAPEIYTRQELDAMFAVMDDDERLIFDLLYQCGLRKRELMYLENADLLVEELAPGYIKREIRVQSKNHWKFKTKNGKSRTIPVGRGLMDRLVVRKGTLRKSELLFGCSSGQPDYHILDKLKAIAKRAGIAPRTVWLHKFRSTCATNWLRSPRFGGKGYDLPSVRKWLGHDDMRVVEKYACHLRNEELIQFEPDLVPKDNQQISHGSFAEGTSAQNSQ
jgi:integrase